MIREVLIVEPVTKRVDVKTKLKKADGLPYGRGCSRKSWAAISQGSFNLDSRTEQEVGFDHLNKIISPNPNIPIC